MVQFNQLKPAAQKYVAGVVVCGVLVIALSVAKLYAASVVSQWFVLAGLTLLTGSFTVKIPAVGASLSVSETFVFVSVLMFGAEYGVITVLLECVVVMFWMAPRGRATYKLIFNVAAPAIGIWISGKAFFWVSGFGPLYEKQVDLSTLFLPLLLLTVLYFLLNSWLVAFAIALEKDCSPIDVWWGNLLWLSLNHFSGASVAAIIVTFTHQIDTTTLAVIVPLLVVSYLTFRAAMGRVEDTNAHLSELNRLYLSTIETLAMAIDAKDQITHGHIRRVQVQAVGLAKHIGISDEKQLRAIEAAALLHDMGKLAVPEHILNKPGKLTPAEFEKMKSHAAIGADILSAIDFPYPVVPIVRHHHENWDGKGYPDGVSGADIPIGARILSVVDCFDALTSDRPYRPRLSDQDAIKILLDRRGTMYDPLVVDTFVRVHTEISPERTPSKMPPQILEEIASARSLTRTRETSHPRKEQAKSTPDAFVALSELGQCLTAGALTGVATAGDQLKRFLQRFVDFSHIVLFLYDAESDELAASYVSGEGFAQLRDFRTKLGHGLSGWVGANRQTIVNSDPTLDVGDVAQALDPPLLSCLSVPIVYSEQLLGVLSLYSSETEAFTDWHRGMVDVIALHVGLILTRQNPSAIGPKRGVAPQALAS